ncbi:nuclear transport factor 2 family protein [Pedobacter nototheniae]|uniref:nuclear transport factor 2 family protein n=1 Tax=Pedobacter nototheniae TaxID=2488994 RepID=UPI00292FCFDB|nr:nuclear transport factor 2 family protein [Pedobacter nototheniae]
MKKLIIFLSAMVFLTACENTRQQAMDTTKNEDLIKQYFAHFNKHDWNKMAEMYTDTAEFKDPSLGQGIIKQTRAQIIKKYQELSTTFPDVKDKVLNIYASGDKHIIVEFLSSGTAPDHSKFELPICTIFTIENGLIVQDFTYYDNFKE